MDPRKRQKKLERRHAKAKAAKKALAVRDPRDLSVRIERAASAPILHCFTTSVLWEEGMSSVVVSRSLPSGNVAFAVFLLDVYCLGIKDVMVDIGSRERYERLVYGKLAQKYELVSLEPAAARKLIEGAVEYARQLGLPPHSDYAKAQRIFGDIDPTSCSQEFTYGKAGKPYFIAGPHDGPGRCRQVIDALTASCGPGGFHYLLPVSRSAGLSLIEGDSADVDDDDDMA
jgi:hypothetical protein